MRRIVIGGVVVAGLGCTTREAPPREEVPLEHKRIIHDTAPAEEPVPESWAVRTHAAADLVLAIVLAPDGTTATVTSEGYFASAYEGSIALDVYEPSGALRFSKALPRSFVPDGRMLALADADTLVVLEVGYVGTGDSTVTLAAHSIADGTIEQRIVWDTDGARLPTLIESIPGGGFVLAGRVDPARDHAASRTQALQPFVAVFDESSALRWTQTLESVRTSAWYDADLRLAVNASSIVLGGRCTGRFTTSRDQRTFDCRHGTALFAAMWSTAGTLHWTNDLADTDTLEDPLLADLALAPNGNIVAAGTFRETLTVGHGKEAFALHARGATDGWIARLDSDGRPFELWQTGGAGIDRYHDVAVDAGGDAWIVGSAYGDAALVLERHEPGARGRKPLPVEFDTERFGIVARIDFERGIAGVLPLRRTHGVHPFNGPVDGPLGRRIAIAGRHVRVAGEYSSFIELPTLDGGRIALAQRDRDGVDDEVFLWAGWAKAEPQAE